MYVLQTVYYDNETRFVGVFSTKEQIHDLLKKNLKDYFLGEIKNKIDVLFKIFSKRNNKRPYATWYDSSYIDFIEELIETYNKTEESCKDGNSWLSDYLIYEVDVDKYIVDYHDHFVERGNSLLTTEEIKEITDLNNYPDLNNIVKNILNNTDMLSFYKKELEVKLINDSLLKMSSWTGSTSL